MTNRDKDVALLQHIASRLCCDYEDIEREFDKFYAEHHDLFQQVQDLRTRNLAIEQEKLDAEEDAWGDAFDRDINTP